MKNLKLMGIYSGIIGLMYLIYGIAEAGSWIVSDPLLPLASPDVMGAFILILIGSILLYRIRSLLDMRYEGLAFLFVGMVLSAIIGMMYVLLILADMADSVITGEPWEFGASYNIPAVILSLLLLPCWEIMRHREDFRE